MRSFLILLVLGGTLSAQPPAGHRVAQAALSILVPLAKQAPDDYALNYTLARTYRLAGNFAAAEQQTQWLLDLRPTYPGGLWEAGLLRAQFNDPHGALEMLTAAFRATPAVRLDDRLALLADLAQVHDTLNQQPQAARLRQEIANLRKAHEAPLTHSVQPDSRRP